MSKRITFLLTGFFVLLTLGGCDDAKARQMAADELQQAQAKLAEVEASGAPQLATAYYQETVQEFNKTQQLVTDKKYTEAQAELKVFYAAADAAIAVAGQAKADARRQVALEAQAELETQLAADVAAKAAAETAAKKATEAAKPRTITVKKGQYLIEISRSKLGNGKAWKEIYELNKGKIKNPNLIYPNQVLMLPADSGN